MRVLAILTLTASLTATGALAQTQAAAPTPPGTSVAGSTTAGQVSAGATAAGTATGGSNARVGTQAPTSAVAPDQPNSWSGTASDWSAHTQACASAYPSYSATTDTYVNKGAQTKCGLATGGGVPNAGRK